jgi:hypothetical protein
MITVITTFANKFWPIYAEEGIRSFVKYWPSDVPLLLKLDDDLLLEDVKKILREGDGISIGISDEQKDFIERNKDKDDPKNYRKQGVRFSHKVFAIKHTLDSIEAARKDGVEVPRYLVWLDADVITTSQVTHELLKNCLPKEGDAVSYLGRKDWEHSECGWLAFDLEYQGKQLINDIYNLYVKDLIFKEEQWHDSWIFDIVRDRFQYKATNLTEGKPGMDIWPESPMAKFSTHMKGPVAKSKKNMPLQIQTKNSRPNEEIQKNIEENQKLIKNWVTTCKKNRERVSVVSAGPQLVAESVKGTKIIAVKHALKELKAAGIKPWACILLDPRPRVNAFVENPNKDIIWFVASQVEPSVTKTLLDAGCTVWGYHAAVGANEEVLTHLQPDSIVTGGSATATRGLYLLEKLGFHKFDLYGYDLCLPDKPDLNEKDEMGQPKNFEITLQVNHEHYKLKKSFWATAELIAQYQEMNDIFQRTTWDIMAYGHGIVPFLAESKWVNNLRKKGKKANMKLVHYKELLNCQTSLPD